MPSIEAINIRIRIKNVITGTEDKERPNGVGGVDCRAAEDENNDPLTVFFGDFTTGNNEKCHRGKDELHIEAGSHHGGSEDSHPDGIEAKDK